MGRQDIKKKFSNIRKIMYIIEESEFDEALKHAPLEERAKVEQMIDNLDPEGIRNWYDKHRLLETMTTVQLREKAITMGIKYVTKFSRAHLLYMIKEKERGESTGKSSGKSSGT